MKPKLQVSFSGGRTSAYMGKMLKDHWSDKYDFIFTFANTGMEHEKTLEFVNNCDKYFGFNTVWLEAVVHHGERKGTEHKIVTFETASRKGEPYEEIIKKYGVPNQAWSHCTREMKIQPMRSYLRSLGINHTEIPTAIGIRADEKRRVSKTAGVNNIIYPLVDTWPVDKQDVLDWWEDQEFGLGIEEFEGNCLGCYKKSFYKHFLQIEKNPEPYEFYDRMEDTYGMMRGESSVFFRSQTSTKKLFMMYEENKNTMKRGNSQLDMYANGGCSESCEVYETTINGE